MPRKPLDRKRPAGLTAEVRPPELLLGAHFSIGGGYCRAVEAAAAYGCRALQIFTKNAATWKEREVTPDEAGQFRRAARQAGIRSLASHTSYLINLASPEREKREASRAALEQELIRAERLGISDVVLHPGAHMGEGVNAGMLRVARGINQMFARLPSTKARLILETTAGQGTVLGRTFEELAAILARIDAPVGVCLDTCHMFAAGYDIRTPEKCRETLAAFDRTLGLDRLRLIHLNDARKGLGERVDRHEHIGRGQIGLAAFRFFMNDERLGGIPKIIETPKQVKGSATDWDLVNLARLRSLVAGRGAALQVSLGGAVFRRR